MSDLAVYEENISEDKMSEDTVDIISLPKKTLRDYIHHIYVIHNPASHFRYQKIIETIQTAFPTFDIKKKCNICLESWCR